MARKRKSRATETPPEPEPVKPAELEPEQLEDTGIPEEDLAEVIETEEVIEEEVTEEEVEEEEEEEAEMVEAEDNTAVAAEKKEPETEISAEAVPENGEKEEEKEGEGKVKVEVEEELEEETLEKLLEPFTKDQLTLLIKEAVAKHPDLVENVNKLADSDPSHRKIFVHGLGWDATTETITAVYGKYGEIEDCRVVKDKLSGKSKGYGFILFSHRSGARRALKEPQKLIEGRMTSCQLASAGPVQASASPVVAAAPSLPVSEYTLRKIFVSNVSAEIDPNKLVEFFSTFGEIEEGPLGLDKQTGKPKGFCLFVYKTVESAKKALEEPHKDFEGVILHCQKAVDGPKHSKGGFFQQTAPPQQQQQHHQQGKQGYYNHPAKKGRYAGSSGGMGRGRGGHLMAPSAGPGMPPMGFNPGVAPAAIGQAVAALLANPSLIGGMGGGMNPQGVPQMMNHAGYGGQVGAGPYGAQPGLQGGYGTQPQMGPGGVRPHQGGPPYMGHGR